MASFHKSRQWLEALKFSVYLVTPVAAVYFLATGKFDFLERSIQNRQYVVYPPEGPSPPRMRDIPKDKADLSRRIEEVRKQ